MRSFNAAETVGVSAEEVMFGNRGDLSHQVFFPAFPSSQSLPAVNYSKPSPESTNRFES